MAESLLLPVVRGVAGKAADALVQSITRMCGVDGDRRKLERQLLAVQCKLTDAEVKSETNPAVKRWMRDLKSVAYEADDVLDDFQYEALRREVNIGDSTTGKVLGYFTPQSPLLFRVTTSRKLNNVLKKINELVEEMNKFGLMEHAEAPQLPYRPTHSRLDEPADIFGRDHDKEVLVKQMLDQHDQQNLQVLPIVGMGGLGKTTLAKMVYNDPSVQEHFQLKMWHCVSENFEAISIVRSIIELATNGRCDLPDKIELLRRRLEEVIARKRFLLVLDDVWNKDENKWNEDLRPLLNSVGGPGSIIVITTRDQRVASIMKTLQPYEPKYLNEDESWELFSMRAFGRDVQEQEDLVTIGKCIVDKCKGLPLALKTMGGLMSSKQQVHEWEAIARSNIGDSVKGKDEILSILKLSYKHLPSEMKQCFAFCAIFCKDYEMEKDMLIQLWIANGFIQEEGGTIDLAEKGEFVFNELVWRSFLQDVKTIQFYPETFRSLCYDFIVCKMHDLMHDLAKDVSSECATTEELIQQKALSEDVWHVQISKDELKQISGSFKGTTSLRTLLMEMELPSYEDLKELKLRSLFLERLKLRSLRGLWCACRDNPSIITSQLINTKHLRYLDLSNCSFVRLPDSVCTLYNLQSLRLNHCKSLECLPEGMTNLRKLNHLYLLGCTSFERMPPNFGLLKNLLTLTMFVVDTDAGRGIEELKELRYLTNTLALYNLRKIRSTSNAKEANLHQKQDLSSLQLSWGRNSNYMSGDEDNNEEEILECLKPHSKLKILGLYGYGGSKVSVWMRDPQMFRCLKRLTITQCPRCKDIPTVWLLASLEYLSLSHMTSLTTLCKNIDGDTPVQLFPKLKELVLHDLPNMERWAENSEGENNDVVIFPELEKLDMQYCMKISSVPESPALKMLSILGGWSIPIFSLSHLRSLSELTYGPGDLDMRMPLDPCWSSPVSLDVSSPANMMVPLEDKKSRRPFESLRSLDLGGSNCFLATRGLSKVHLRLWDCFAFVKELSVHYCNDLVQWPMEELRCLICLRNLSFNGCDKLEGKCRSSDEALPLPQLETFIISSCHNLLDIPKMPTSIEYFGISHCKSLVALPSHLRNLPRLRSLYVGNMDALKMLPDGMNGFTALEELKIIDCPQIEKFPEGLVRRLPAMKSLIIEECPASAWFPDQFGVLHDGKKPYPGAVLALENLAEKGAKVVIISKSSTRSSVTMEKLKEAWALGEHDIICLEDVHEIASIGAHFREASNFPMPFKLKFPERRLQMKKKPYKNGDDSGGREDKINELIDKLN
uniref:Uncharacterized protein n=1 Tax=Oryza punctata TaxID=4537 RepID=A0A0E0LXI5_ORYPU